METLTRKRVKSFVISLLIFTFFASGNIAELTRLFIVTINPESKVLASIIGQVEWFDLLIEILFVILVTPLYYLFGKKLNMQKLFVIVFCICSIYGCLIYFNISNIIFFMNVPIDIIAQTKAFLEIENIAQIFSIFPMFFGIYFFMNNRWKYLSIITITKLTAVVFFDYLLIKNHFSMGVGISHIIVGGITSILGLILFNIDYKKILIKCQLKT